MTSSKQFFNTTVRCSPNADLDVIKKAYFLAAKAHKNQKRESGEPYLVHPQSVTSLLSKLNLDTETLAAALLHDTYEDTDISLELIKKKFGRDVTTLVNGVSKLKKLNFKNKQRSLYEIENYRKMFVAMAEDIRVILIKLADRFHNLQTLSYCSKEKQKRKAKETLDIYAPIANRLGMGELKGQLEDLAFPILYPREAAWVKKLSDEEVTKKDDYISDLKSEINKKLSKAGIDVVSSDGRVKHVYSLYKKLKRHDNNINKIHDLFAVRFVVKNIPDCYTALGIIHNNYKPLIGRIKDYISIPKTNGYRSLHTTVICPDGEIVEIQIRTEKMHEEAEYGVAAHWHYTDSGKPKEGEPIKNRKYTWIKQLADWQKDNQNSKDFQKTLKLDFFKDRIFVITPGGDIKDLPDGATPIDFAYSIHTSIGEKCQHAKVNNKIVPLDHKLINGDLIEIHTGKKQTPKLDWLNFVKTSQAKANIKNWFRKINKEKNLELGKNILDQEVKSLKNTSLDKITKNKLNKAATKFNMKHFDDVLIKIGLGEISTRQVIKAIFATKEIITPQINKKYIFFGKPYKKPKAKIEGEIGYLTKIARCCNPTVKDDIKAYITRSRGASIHKSNCKELKKKHKEGRIVKASWIDQDIKSYHATIIIKCFEKVGMIRDISAIISDHKINICNISYRDKPTQDIKSILLTLEVPNIERLLTVIKKLEKHPSVLNVSRK